MPMHGARRRRARFNDGLLCDGGAHPFAARRLIKKSSLMRARASHRKSFSLLLSGPVHNVHTHAHTHVSR